jgi:hypothetical protein
VCCRHDLIPSKVAWASASSASLKFSKKCQDNRDTSLTEFHITAPISACLLEKEPSVKRATDPSLGNAKAGQHVSYSCAPGELQKSIQTPLFYQMSPLFCRNINIVSAYTSGSLWFEGSSNHGQYIKSNILHHCWTAISIVWCFYRGWDRIGLNFQMFRCLTFPTYMNR